jgi:hypothetical protein
MSISISNSVLAANQLSTVQSRSGIVAPRRLKFESMNFVSYLALPKSKMARSICFAVAFLAGRVAIVPVTFLRYIAERRFLL